MQKPLSTTKQDFCQDHLICVSGTPVKLICDQNLAFMSHLTQTILLSYGVKLITVSPTNHRSLLAEQGIKSLSNILIKHLTWLGLNWDIYCKPAMLVYNSNASPNPADFSPFELLFGRKANICPEFQFKHKCQLQALINNLMKSCRKSLDILDKLCKSLERLDTTCWIAIKCKIMKMYLSLSVLCSWIAIFIVWHW